MGVEKDVRGSLRGVVDGRSRNHHERGWTRESNPDVDADPHLRVNGYDSSDHEHRAEHESLHGLLPFRQAGPSRLTTLPIIAAHADRIQSYAPRRLTPASRYVAGSAQPSHSHTPRPMTHARSSPLSQGRCSVKSVTHS